MQGQPCRQRKISGAACPSQGFDVAGCTALRFSGHLARIIHDYEDTKSLFCYKHVIETVFARAREAFACLTIAQHSVCCSPVFFPSLPCCSSISRAIPMAE